jgi:hypothetical protein
LSSVETRIIFLIGECGDLIDPFFRKSSLRSSMDYCTTARPIRYDQKFILFASCDLRKASNPLNFNHSNLSSISVCLNELLNLLSVGWRQSGFAMLCQSHRNALPTINGSAKGAAPFFQAIFGPSFIDIESE